MIPARTAPDLVLFYEQMKNHPLIKQIEDEQELKRQRKRKEAADRIEVLKEEHLNVISKMRGKLTEMQVKLDKARVTLRAAENEYIEISSAIRSKDYGFDHAINREKQVLLDTYDPIIDEAIDFFEEKLGWLRKSERIVSREEKKKNLISMQDESHRTSNYAKIASAIEYCQRCIKEIEGMRLLVEIDELYIHSLMAGVPSIEI